MVDPRTPVIVGAGQVSQRVDDPSAALEPVDLLAEVARAADADAGARRSFLGALDTIAVVDIVSWKYPDPAAALARRLGATPRRTITTTVGGNSPQLLVNALADAIQQGEANAVLMGGAEALRTRFRARRPPKTWLDWSREDDPPCGEVVGDDRPGSSAYEEAHEASFPIHVYPMIETALRQTAGHDIEEHQAEVARLWSHFAAVSADNPHAWSRTPYTADEIRVPGDDNRMVTFPYTKRMCANESVDQAAALLLCSYDAARAAGVPDDRLVFLLACADGTDHYFLTERWSLAESPGLHATATGALAAAGLDPDDVARFDLYSCFPSAVQAAMRALGLRGPAAGDERPLTVTGGLAFAGGPASNYVTHAISRMVDACRADRGSIGFVSAVGWYLTKHAVGLYSTTPTTGGFRRVDPAVTQAAIDALPRREPAGPYEGAAVVEGTAVVMNRDGSPRLGIVAALAPDARRALATTDDLDACTAMTKEPWEGRSVRLHPDGDHNRLDI